MATPLLTLVEEYKRLDRRRRQSRDKFSAKEEQRLKYLSQLLAEKLHGASPPERRKELRVPTSLRVRYQNEKTFINNYIYNLSKGGVFISTPKPLPLDTHIKLRLVFQDQKKEIELEGVVVWENVQKQALGHDDITRPGMGVKFTKMSDEAREEIDEIIHEHLTEQAKLEDEHAKKIKD